MRKRRTKDQGCKSQRRKRKYKLAYRSREFESIDFETEGQFFDLLEIFDELRQRYFRGRLSGYEIKWMRRRKQRPLDYLIFGSIQEDDRVIRINPLLDRAFVPRWFLRYVIYHEMLHAVVPSERLSRGRRRVHTEEFNRRERTYPAFRRALRWERRNLFRFFRPLED